MDKLILTDNMQNRPQSRIPEEASRYLNDKNSSQLWSLTLVCRKEAYATAFMSLNLLGSDNRVFLKLKKSDKRPAHLTHIN